jgi:hypothetical protein
VLSAWWWSLHLLLLAAAALVGWPVLVKGLAAATVLVHGILRRPRGSPRLVVVSAGGLCSVPEWQAEPRPLGERTLVCPFWVRLDVGAGPGRRDIVLVADQVRPEEWRRLRAILDRVRRV